MGPAELRSLHFSFINLFIPRRPVRRGIFLGTFMTSAPAAGTAALALLVSMILWSSSFIALKFSFQYFDPMVVIFGRMAIASCCFALLYVGRRDFFQLKFFRREDLKLLIIMVIAEPCLYFLCEAHAINLTTASQAGVITAILPVLVMIAASRLLGERMPRIVWAGALLALAGVIALTLAGSASESAPHPILGNFLEFVAMLCATVYTIAMKKLASRYSPLFLTAVQAITGCIFFFPLLFFPGTELPHEFNTAGTLAVIYLGAVITIGAYGLYNFSLKYVTASRAAACVNLIPVFSVLLGWLLLGERLNGTQIIAGGMILLGVFFTQKR